MGERLVQYLGTWPIFEILEFGILSGRGLSMALSRSLNVLFVSTSVGPLGSGLGGGVELTLQNCARSLQQRGHRVQIIAPAGSVLPDFPVIAIAGQLQPTAQTEGRDAWIAMPTKYVIANLCDYVHQV